MFAPTYKFVLSLVDMRSPTILFESYQWEWWLFRW